MSLNWQWNDKMGEVTDKRGYTSNLYRGNAFMIAVNEFKQDGEDVYTLAWFFCDKKHLENCIGLSKGYEENSIGEWGWKKFRLNTRYKETAIFLQALCKAKATDIEIELYYEEEVKK